MNPVAMQEVNRARHQDVNRAVAARRRASANREGHSGLMSLLLKKTGRVRGRGERFPALSSEERRGVSAA